MTEEEFIDDLGSRFEGAIRTARNEAKMLLEVVRYALKEQAEEEQRSREAQLKTWRPRRG